MKAGTIFVALKNEDVAVWRPALAEWVHSNVYRIIEQQRDPDEEWGFNPGDLVECHPQRLGEGEVLVAQALAKTPGA